MKPRMHRSFLVIAAALIAGTVSAAPFGRHGDAAARVDARIESMTEQLDLTEAQQEQIRALIAEHHASLERSREQMRAQIDGVLTASQRETRDQLQSKRMDRRLDRMSARLDLSDDQREAIRAIFEERRTNPDLTRSEIRERIDAVLSAEQREALAQVRERRRPGPGRGRHSPASWSR